MSCAVCGGTAALAECDDCHRLFCWRHKQGGRQQHDCKDYLSVTNVEGMDLDDGPIVTLVQVCRTPLRFIELTRSPKRLIYADDDPIRFTAHCYTDDYVLIDNGPLTFDWRVDDVSVGTERSSHDHRFSAALDLEGRRKDYRVTVTATDTAGNVSTSPPQVIRVAQSAWVGTPAIATGQDPLVTHFGEIFGDIVFEPSNQPTLQYTPTLPKGQMDSRAYPRRPPVGVRVCDLAYAYPREEFEAMLWHECLHCRQYMEGTNPDSGFYWLWDQDGRARAGAMECAAFALYLTAETRQGAIACSYKFLKEYGVVAEIVTRYLQVVHPLGEARIQVHEQIKYILDLCIQMLREAFPELRHDDAYEELAGVREALHDQQYWPVF